MRACDTAGSLEVCADGLPAWGDFDGDGDLGFFHDGVVYRDHGNANHWVELDLEARLTRTPPRSPRRRRGPG